MPPSLPASSFIWTLALSTLALWNIRLISAVPSTIIVDHLDTRIQYTPAQQWYHDPSKSSSSSYNGSYSWTNGASAIFRFTGIGINITGPTGPNQALRMILLNNVSMGTCGPETPELEPPTSFFLKNLDYGDHIVEVRHVDTRPNRTLSIDTFCVTVDNDLYPPANVTIKSASFSANQSSDAPTTDVMSSPQVSSSTNIMALIIALPLLFLCLVCPIGTWLWVRRRHRLGHHQRGSTDMSERVLEPGHPLGHSRRTTPSNLSEYGIDALTIQDQLSAPPTMGPSMAAAMLDANGLVSTPTPSRRRQRTTTLSSGSAAAAAAVAAAGYPPGVLPPTMRTPSFTGDGLDEYPTVLPAGSSLAPTPPLVDLTERRRSRSPTAFFSRLSHNFATAFRSPSEPLESTEVDGGGGGTDDASIAESYSTPMTLGVRLNRHPFATASSTLHGSDSEGGSGKPYKPRWSIASHTLLSEESTQAPSLSSRASLGHSPGSGGLRVQQRDPSPSSAPDVPGDVPTPGSAQSGQLSLLSVSSGMVTALTHQTIELSS